MLSILRPTEPLLAIFALITVSLMYGCAHQQESFVLEESICSDSQFFPLLDYKTTGYIQRDELVHISQNLGEKNFKASDESKNIQIGYFNFLQNCYAKLLNLQMLQTQNCLKAHLNLREAVWL